MKNQLNLDPSSPYYRECLYCNEPFMAHHGLQKFCPNKNGKKDYCKYEYKALKNNVVIDVKEDVPNEIPILTSSPVIENNNSIVNAEEIPIIVSHEHIIPEAVLQINKSDTIMQVPASNVDTKNEEIISKLMGNFKERKFTLDEITASGLNVSKFDKKTQLPYCNLTMLEIGNYGLMWTSDETITIIHLNQLLWIS